MASVNDLEPEYQLLSPVPEFTHLAIPEANPEDQSTTSFLVLASDGIWSVMNNNQVVECVASVLTGKNGSKGGRDRCQAAAKLLCETAVQNPMSYDDTTAVVIWFKT